MVEEHQERIAKLPHLDISNELFREYIYADGKKLRVYGAKTLILEKRVDGDRHRLIVKDSPNEEYGMYIQPGWLAIKWTTPDKKHGITF